MAALSGALDAIVQRLETHTPARDPQVLYKHLSVEIASKPDRTFRLIPPADVQGSSITTPDPMRAVVQLEVYYREKAEVHDLFKDVADDLEDLWQRLAYFCGSEWAAGYSFVVINARIAADADGPTIRMSLAVTYNMME